MIKHYRSKQISQPFLMVPRVSNYRSVKSADSTTANVPKIGHATRTNRTNA